MGHHAHPPTQPKLVLLSNQSLYLPSVDGTLLYIGKVFRILVVFAISVSFFAPPPAHRHKRHGVDVVHREGGGIETSVAIEYVE